MKFADFGRSRPDPERNVFAFVCADEYLLHESRAVWAGLFGDGWRIEKLSAKEFESLDATHMAEDARTPSLFAESRAYLVTQAGKLKKDRIEALIELNALPNSSVKVVLAFEERKTAESLPKAFQRIEIDAVQAADAARWVVQRYKTPPDLAGHIVEQVGADLFPLYNEMEKLKCYVGDRPITLRDAEISILRAELFGAWDLDDALYAKSYAKAVRLVGAMLDAGDEPLRLLSTIARVWRQLFAAKGLAGRTGASEVAMAVGAPAFKGAAIVAASRRYEWKQLAMGFRSIRAADRAFKSSSPNPEVYFDVMLWKLMEGEGI
jgi:DNA polymerase-3 subunit delta